MTLGYAEPALATKRPSLDGAVALFVAAWVALLVVPPVIYTPMVASCYSGFKTELPGATRMMLDFGAWNAQWGWLWLAVPPIAGVVSARLTRPVDAIAELERRQRRLFAALVLTLVGLLIALLQLSVLLAPWTRILWSVSGRSAAPGGAPAGP